MLLLLIHALRLDTDHAGLDQIEERIPLIFPGQFGDLRDGFAFETLVAALRHLRHKHVIPIPADVAIPVFPVGSVLYLAPQFLAQLRIAKCLEKGFAALREVAWVDHRAEAETVADIWVDICDVLRLHLAGVYIQRTRPSLT